MCNFCTSCDYVAMQTLFCLAFPGVKSLPKQMLCLYSSSYLLLLSQNTKLCTAKGFRYRNMWEQHTVIMPGKARRVCLCLCLCVKVQRKSQNRSRCCWYKYAAYFAALHNLAANLSECATKTDSILKSLSSSFCFAHKLCNSCSTFSTVFQCVCVCVCVYVECGCHCVCVMWFV